MSLSNAAGICTRYVQVLRNTPLRLSEGQVMQKLVLCRI